ncbi:MAG TPA: hypothetical protein VIY52_06615 [Streptosporangiaceae bacterium]
MAEGVGVATADGVAVGELPRRGVPVGDPELVGLAFGVGVDVVVGGDVVRAGADEVEGAGEDCPVVEELPPVAVGVGLTST